MVDVVEKRLGNGLYLLAAKLGAPGGEAGEVTHSRLFHGRGPIRLESDTALARAFLTSPGVAVPTSHLREVKQRPDKQVHKSVGLHRKLEQQVLRMPRFEVLPARQFCPLLLFISRSTYRKDDIRKVAEEILECRQGQFAIRGLKDGRINREQ